MAINKNYLQLSFGDGQFFDYSPTEKEGYKKHISIKGNVSYRKYYDKGVEGKLDSVSLYDGKFGQQISMNIKNGDEVYYVPVDLYDQRGNVGTFAESLIKFLPVLDKGQDVIVGAYNFIPEGDKYAKVGIYFKVDGEKLVPALRNSYITKDGELVEHDIPAIEWVNKLGKNKPSATSLEAKDNFLLGVVEKELERLTWKRPEGESKPEPQSEATPQEVVDKAADASAKDFVKGEPKKAAFTAEKVDKLPF